MKSRCHLPGAAVLMHMVRPCLSRCSLLRSGPLARVGDARCYTALNGTRKLIHPISACYASSAATATTTGRDFVPLRKQLKDEAKAKRLAKGKGGGKNRAGTAQHDGWELTVGIEVHAQLDTDAKLFSSKPDRGRIASCPLL